MAKRTHLRVEHDDQLTLDLQVKTCPRCQRDLPGWDFARNRARSDGLQVYCRKCWNLKQSEYYEGSEEYRRRRQQRAAVSYQRHRDRYKVTRKEYREANKEAFQGRARLWYDANRELVRERKTAWRKANPDLHRERNTAYNLANPEKVRARRRAYREANRDVLREKDRAWLAANRGKHRAKGARRRAREAAVTAIEFTADDLAKRWAYYGNNCWICKGQATATDHVKPISKGGAHMLCNLRPICKSCNSAKHAKWPFTPDMIRRDPASLIG